MQRQQVKLSANYMFNVIENQVADVSGLQYSQGSRDGKHPKRKAAAGLFAEGQTLGMT